jgi:hypothetical protein
MKDTSWAALSNVLTWRDLSERYLEALQQCEAYMKAHPAETPTSAISAAMGGLAAVYVGLRPILANPDRADEPASKEFANIVLALVRKIRREIPVTEPGQETP